MEFLLTALLLVGSQNESLHCNKHYEIPRSIAQVLEQEKGTIEINEETPQGYFSSFFVNRIYVEGWFYEREGKIVACDVSYVIKLDETGKAIFHWHKGDKEAHNPYYPRYSPWVANK